MSQPDAAAAPQLAPIERLNELDRAAFAAALRPLFETAPPLADALYAARPFESYGQLLDRAAAAIGQLDEHQRVAVVNAHPRIGESAAAVRRESALSYREQGYEREAALDQGELARTYAELGELNQRYEARFGFRFVVFVNGRPKSAIIEVLRERLERPRDQELSAALDAMLAIARDRLAKLQGVSAKP